MDIPDELTLEIFDRASLDDLVNLCNTSAYYRGICNREFWERKFVQNQTFLLHPQSNPRDWANELLHSIISMERARTVFENFKIESSGHDSILVYSNSIQSADIFPDFLDKKKINSLLLYSRIRHDEENVGGDIRIEDPDNPTFVFEVYTGLGQTKEYRQSLTDEQALYLVFLFFYYVLKVTDIDGQEIYDARNYE